MKTMRQRIEEILKRYGIELDQRSDAVNEILDVVVEDFALSDQEQEDLGILPRI